MSFGPKCFQISYLPFFEIFIMIILNDKEFRLQNLQPLKNLWLSNLYLKWRQIFNQCFTIFVFGSNFSSRNWSGCLHLSLTIVIFWPFWIKWLWRDKVRNFVKILSFKLIFIVSGQDDRRCLTLWKKWGIRHGASGWIGGFFYLFRTSRFNLKKLLVFRLLPKLTNNLMNSRMRFLFFHVLFGNL